MFKTARAVIKANKESYKVPRNCQQLIPVERVFDDGIFQIGKVYSQTWKISDINFAVSSMDDKRSIFLLYSILINWIPVGGSAKLSIVKHAIDRAAFEESIFIPLRGDDKDRFVREYNGMLESNANSTNNIITEKYVTLTMPRKSIEDARTFFYRHGAELSNHVNAMGSSAVSLSATERLRIFHDFYRQGQPGFTFDLEQCRKKGHAFKDSIAPDSFEMVNGSTIKLGNKFVRTLFLREYANFIKDSLITEFTDLNRPMVLSIDILPIPTDEALAEVEKKVLGADTDVANWQRSQNKHGNFSADVPPQLERARKESRELEDDLTMRDQRLFFAFVSITHSADTLEALDADADNLIATGRKHLCQLAPMAFRQLEGLQTALPFGPVRVHETEFRTLNTESVAILMPFKAQEISDVGGVYCGRNAVSKNLIMVDRKQLQNSNGFYLGVSGSGKSFFVKREIIARVLRNAASGGNCEVVIIDPEREFGAITRALGGEVINISASSEHHINAMDMHKDYGEGRNPLIFKSEHLLAVFETLMGDDGLSSRDKSIIDRCIAKVYRPYIKSGYKIDPPTLPDLYNELMAQEEEEAKNIALSAELFVNGSMNVFAKPTNVDTQNPLICFDVRDMGEQLMSLGLLVVLDAVMNRVLKNAAEGKETWVFVDECYLFFAHQYSSNFFYKAYKRFRKLNAVMSCVSQNVEELLESKTARLMLANSEFLAMFNTAATDRAELATLLNISEMQLSYITNADVGKGLLRCAGSIVPFEDAFPRNTELYKLITTKPSEGYGA